MKGQILFHDIANSSVPSMGRVVGRGVTSRSPASEECRGGELMIMPSLASCEGGPGVCRRGDD